MRPPQDQTLAYDKDRRRADIERHWAYIALTRWLQVPAVHRAVAVTSVLTFALGVFAGGALFGTRRIDRTPNAGVSCPVSGSNKPGALDPFGGCFPGPGNTGVPAGTSLTTYSGATTISTTVTINAKTINSRLTVVSGGNLTITNSQSMIGIDVEGTGVLTMSDSYATGDDNDFKVISAEGAGLTLLRNDIGDGISNSGGWCLTNCVLTDNWIHNETVLPSDSTAHMSGWRMRQNGTFTHNTFECNVAVTAADGGCSANFTGYGDFEAVINNTMNQNLYTAHHGSSYCSYGGSSTGKPFSSGTHDIKFTNNIFQKGTGWGAGNGFCADFGAVGDYDPAKSGNAFTNNKYDDGTTVVPS